jgi:hypothetical protein
MKTENIEVVFSFDTTGSMYPCLTQVRRTIEQTIRRLFNEVPNIRIGITAHGDYCDAHTSYVTKHHPLSDDQSSLVQFVRTVSPTGGGDSPECYELVLHEARSFNWTHGKSKVLVLIGDDVPHGPTEKQNSKKLDWRNEISNLMEMGVNVYGVQALGRSWATKFYEEIANKTGGFKLDLDQFSYVTDMILAIAFKQAGDEVLKRFEREVQDAGRMNRSLDKAFAKLTGRKVATSFGSASLDAVSPGRFQVLSVDSDQDIKGFVLDNGLTFNVGRGFYEFTKRETIQAYKEVVLMDKKTGDMFSGPKARQLIGLPDGEEAKMSPTALDKFRVFVQSTSANRKLKGNTGFLYEVNDWR